MSLLLLLFPKLSSSTMSAPKPKAKKVESAFKLTYSKSEEEEEEEEVVVVSGYFFFSFFLFRSIC